MNDMIKIVLIVALIAAVIIFGPLITIWSLNTLFPALAIPTNIATWFATLWIFGFFATSVKGNK
jgi:multisubunit Na+/H+ antiporter MnhG subunit